MPKKRHAQDNLESSPKRSASIIHSSDSTTNQSLNSVLQATAAALDNSRFDDAIAQSSAAYNDFCKSIVQILELRARAWAKKGNGTQELADALNMIHAAPDHVKGYIRAGRLYSMRGYQSTAMKMFKKGLDNVPSTDPDYALLRQGYDQAKARSGRRVDFIAKCPYDIVSCIMNHMRIGTIVEAVKVSRIWRAKLLENPSCWRRFHIRSTDFEKSNSLLPAVAHHVEELELEEDMVLINKSLGLIQAQAFPNLSSLAIYHHAFERGIMYEPYEDTCSVLLTLSKTLKSLYINHKSINIPPLAVVLLICRNLTLLELTHPYSNDNWLAGLSLPHTTLLTSLSLSAPRSNPMISVNQIGELLHRSPALKRVMFANYSADILPIIVQHCRNLEFIAFNPQFYFDEAKLELPDSETTFVRPMILGGDFTMRSIQPLLEAYHDSVTNLYLCPTVSVDDTPDHEWRHSLSAYTFPSLTELYVSERGSQISTGVASLVRQSPGLVDIIITGFGEGHTRDTIDAASHIKQVKSFTTVECFVGVTRFQVFNRCHLSRLVVDNCFDLTDQTLMDIAAVKSLEVLHIDGDRDEEVSNVEHFTEALGSLPCLNDVFFGNIRINDISVRNLCVSTSLKYVALLSCTASDEVLSLLEERGVDVVT